MAVRRAPVNDDAPGRRSCRCVMKCHEMSCSASPKRRPPASCMSFLHPVSFRLHRRRLGCGASPFRGRVEDWRASFRVRWLFRRFRVGPQSGSHDCVSSPRSSNRACGFPASGFRTRSCPSHSEGPWSFASGARGCIRHAASRPGSAQSSRPSPCAFDRATGVAAYQLPRQFPKPAPHAIRLNVRKALSVRPGSAVAATDPPPGFGEKVLAPHLVDQARGNAGRVLP